MQGEERNLHAEIAGHRPSLQFLAQGVALQDENTRNDLGPCNKRISISGAKSRAANLHVVRSWAPTCDDTVACCSASPAEILCLTIRVFCSNLLVFVGKMRKLCGTEKKGLRPNSKAFAEVACTV